VYKAVDPFPRYDARSLERISSTAARVAIHPPSDNMPSIATPSATPSKSGIAVSENGERHIPSSVRADGSVRKEIRVRPGYRPPEDVEVYKNRTAEAWRSRSSGGVPGSEAPSSPDKSNPAANKNAKRREARKKAASAAMEVKDGEAIDAAVQLAAPKGEPNADVASKEPIDPEVEREKEAKKLSKKLRQARELKDKKDKGDALLPEQFEKVIRMSELIRQLDSLGFDANGERKENGAAVA